MFCVEILIVVISVYGKCGMEEQKTVGLRCSLTKEETKLCICCTILFVFTLIIFIE